jgi:hypothetical protein
MGEEIYERGDGALEVDVVLPERVVGVNQQMLALHRVAPVSACYLAPVVAPTVSAIAHGENGGWRTASIVRSLSGRRTTAITLSYGPGEAVGTGVGVGGSGVAVGTGVGVGGSVGVGVGAWVGVGLGVGVGMGMAPG